MGENALWASGIPIRRYLNLRLLKFASSKGMAAGCVVNGGGHTLSNNRVLVFVGERVAHETRYAELSNSVEMIPNSRRQEQRRTVQNSTP
jgi:hypothetical protein